MASSKQVKLYHFPGSYYSLKALLTLYEKGVSFEEQVVNIQAGEQNQDWYLAINKNGEVPVLQVDDKYIAESETIIDVIDETFTSGPRLVPEVETGYGSDVRDFRKLLDDIPIDVITYGIICNRHLKHKDGVVQIPSFVNQKLTEQKFNGEVGKLRKKMDNSPPEVRTAIEKKIEKVTSRLRIVTDEKLVMKHQDDLELVFDKIEKRLQRSKRDNDGKKDVWLFGTEFTAADVTATTLLVRLQFVGLDPRYFSCTTRPEVYEYYCRLMNKASVKKMMLKLAETQGILKKMMLKSLRVKVLKVGMVVGLVGLVYVGIKKYGASVFQKS